MRTACRRACLLGLVLVLAGCASAAPTPPATTATAVDPLAAVDVAIAQFNTARAGALDASTSLVDLVMAIDAVDEAAAGGARPATQDALAALPEGEPFPPVVAALSSAASGYAQVLAALDDALREPDVAPAVVEPLTQVLTSAGRELSAVRGLQQVSADAGPYTQLLEHQRAWLTRAEAGWYSSQVEGGDAYAVLTDSEREQVAALAARLADGDAALSQASQATSATLTQAREQLGQLGPSGVGG